MDYRWIILIIITYCIFSYGIIFQSIPPILSILIKTFKISYAEAGALMSLFTLPKFLISLPVGILVDRYGVRVIGILSLTMMVIGTGIVASGNSFFMLLIGRFLGGMGAAGMVVVGGKGVTSWFYNKEIGFAMGIFNLSMPLATVLSLNLMGIIAYQSNWRTSILICFISGLIALFLFIIFYKNKERVEEIRISSKVFSSIRRAGLGIWFVGITWGLFNAGLISFITFGPDYFTNMGIDPGKAGLISSYPMWGGVILSPFIGILIDKIGRKWLFVSIGCGGMALFFILIILFPQEASIFAISIGIFVAILTPAIFSLPAEILPESLMGLGFGIHGTSLGIGISLGPYIIGILRDITGNYILSFITMAVFTALGILPMLLLRRKIVSKNPSKDI